MAFDHIGLSVGDLPKSRAFFLEALAPLGLFIVMEGHGWVGFGSDGRAIFWLGEAADKSGPIHMAFAASSREDVVAFHTAALAAGGLDNGAPGVRAIYHPDYYGAFVFDPDGNNIEAVCRRPAEG